MMDSLTYLNYYRIALWLTGRVEPLVKGSAGPRKQRGYSPTAPTSETAQEPVFCPEDMQLPEEELRSIWNEFYASKETL